MSERVFAISDYCVACKTCETACALAHSESGNLAQAIQEQPLPRQRIHIHRTASGNSPSLCHHCSDAGCMAACPTGAMHRATEGGPVTVDKERCIGCWMCVVSCPFGAVSTDALNHQALKCDLCPERTAAGELPACVAACPTTALRFMTPEAFAEAQRQRSCDAEAAVQPAAEQSSTQDNDPGFGGFDLFN